ncbi:DUF1850 domain-containing protein [Mesorhizobium xinjiangense]|uniref:DUF1850 domain-containing protein n=1 Tax=Mesorhizobium xinjiangense TaxID=2678685 RepID=UPI0012ED6B21|nr:DUF1850 domain-containing protein [Mesorhizobium xinjiangense]
MSLCVIAGGKTAVLAAAAFTLSWTHSVEKTRWEESWRWTPAGFEIVEARVQGSGAGMDPGEGAVLKDGWWVWRPRVPAQSEIVLAASGATVGGWRICADGACRTLGTEPGATVVIRQCEAGER